MHPEDIKASIRKAGSSPAAIAREKNVSRMTVSYTIRGICKSARIAKAISTVCNIPVAQLWPGKYPELAFTEKLTSKKSPAQLEAELRSMHTPSRRTSGSAQRKAVAV
jgi:lambda repressor-like predicted transcriptional regulator